MHLSSMPIFERASPEAIDLLRRKAELVTLEPGQALYRDGEESDAMYFVRYGTLRLTEGDGRVIRYVSRGDSVGVGSMLAKRPRFASCVALDLGRESVRSRRSSTAGRVELVKISAALFEEVSRMFPELRTTAREIVEQRTQGTGTIGLGVENLAGKLGLVQSEHLMLIDLDRCTRCDDCVRACADTHDGISRLCREGPRFGRFLIPETCRQCLDPTCLIGCPVGSIHRGNDGEIVIEDWCIGCGLCAEQCPYDAIDIAGEEQRRAVVCDQCRSIGDGTPMCVYACGHDAALRVDGRQFFAAGIKK